MKGLVRLRLENLSNSTEYYSGPGWPARIRRSRRVRQPGTGFAWPGCVLPKGRSPEEARKKFRSAQALAQAMSKAMGGLSAEVIKDIQGAVSKAQTDEPK